MQYQITDTAGLGSFTTNTPTNGGGFLAGLGNTFNEALSTTLQYGLPQWLDYDYQSGQGAPGNGQWTNNPVEYRGADPTVVARDNMQRAQGMPGNIGLYIALGVAALGVVLIVTD